MVDERAQGRDRSRFLSTTDCPRRDEQACMFPHEGARGPQTSAAIPEGLPLGRKISKASGDAEQDPVVFGQIGGTREDLWLTVLGFGVHLAQDLIAQCLGNPVGHENCQRRVTDSRTGGHKIPPNVHIIAPESGVIEEIL